MKTVKSILCFLLLLSLCFIPSFVFAEEGEELVKDYDFVSEDENNLSYDAPAKITEEGKEYTLDYITYEVIKEVEPYSVEKEVNVNNLEDFKEEIKETVNGKEITLKAEEPEWEKKELPREHIIREEYRYFGANEEIPSFVMINGDRYLNTNVVEESSLEPFTTPAYFASSDKNNTIFSFNGKLVEISGSDPVWDGWKEDVMDYLKISSPSYIIDSISWNGDFTGEEGNYTREATVSGRQTSYSYLVTYTFDSERELREEDIITYLYTAKVTYVEEKEPSYEAVAHAHYSPVVSSVVEEVIPEEESKGLTLAESLGIGVGLAAVAGAGSYLFYFLAKKKKKDEA